MENQIAKEVKEERSHKIFALDERCRREFLERFAGRELEVLFEQEKDGFLDGKAPNYLVVRVPAEEGAPGEIKTVRIEKTDGDGLFGHVIKDHNG